MDDPALSLTSGIGRSGWRTATLALCTLFSSALAAGCSFGALFEPPATGAPTATLSPTPSPTSTPSGTPSPTPGPLTIATPAVILEPPGGNPSPTPVPPPANLPLEALAILEPGPGSHVTQSFQVVGYGGPSTNDRVTVRLMAEDGSVLAETSLLLLVYPGGAGRFLGQISYRFDQVSMVGWLQAETRDRRLGLISHVNTRELVLLSVGAGRDIPSDRGPEQIAIMEPIEGDFVDQGRVVVRGLARREADVPLVVEIWDQRGQILSSAEIYPAGQIPSRTTAFEANLNLELQSAQYGRIVVYERLPDDLGVRHLSSIEVYLRP